MSLGLQIIDCFFFSFVSRFFNQNTEKLSVITNNMTAFGHPFLLSLLILRNCGNSQIYLMQVRCSGGKPQRKKKKWRVPDHEWIDYMTWQCHVFLWEWVAFVTAHSRRGWMPNLILIKIRQNVIIYSKTFGPNDCCLIMFIHIFLLWKCPKHLPLMLSSWEQLCPTTQCTQTTSTHFSPPTIKLIFLFFLSWGVKWSLLTDPRWGHLHTCLWRGSWAVETGGVLKGDGQVVQFTPQEALVSLQELPKAPVGGALCRGPRGGYRSGPSWGLGLRPGGEKRWRIQHLLHLIFRTETHKHFKEHSNLFYKHFCHLFF
jgi:hypothetical protein